jgi:hypothetical protein
MIELLSLIREQIEKPKAVVMAGGGGTGKTFLLKQLDLPSLTQFNPDKYVEDPNHRFHRNLGAASIQVGKDVEDAAEKGISFVWDTTASNPSKIKSLIDKGYDVYMIMVYAHPMISYIANFGRDRSLPSIAVFSTWRNVYQLISQYQEMLGDNLSIFINDRGGKFNKEIEDFNKAAERGVKGITEYLKSYNEKMGTGKSSFFEPVKMSSEEEKAFQAAVADVDYDRNNRSEDKAMKQEFLKLYRKNGVGPGDDQLLKARNKFRDKKASLDKKTEDVLKNIAELLFSSDFQNLLKSSSVADIDKKVQKFLA